MSRASPFRLAVSAICLMLPAAAAAQAPATTQAPTDAAPAAAPLSAVPPPQSALRSALAHVAARNWTEALTVAAAAGPVARDIVEWHRLRAGEGNLGEYEAFVARRGDWPGIDLVLRRGETAVARSQTPARVLAWFGDRAPETAEGALALLAALRRTGQDARADTVAAQAWISLSLTPEAQVAFLAAEGAALAAHHVARLDRLIWNNRGEEARRMFPLVPQGWQRLAEARLGLMSDASGPDQLVAAVPAALAQDAGLAHARFDWRARKGRADEAAALLLERSASAESLGNPAAWARRRAALVRAAMRAGEGQRAYDLAAQHHLTGGGDFADLEFLAGFVALRLLGDPDRARGHFARLEAGVSTPISLARGAYWTARAEEAAGRAAVARDAYARAAGHQTAYYGLLAAERLDLPLDPALVAAPEAHADWRRGAFMAHPLTEAVLLLHAAGDAPLARRFAGHLAERLDPEGLRGLGELARALGDDHLAVLVGKQAAARGIILPALYYPDTALLPPALAVPRPLALAIARRESEFNPAAISPAGAQGLMQLMPGTARLMSDRLGMPHEVSALISDPGRNATLGAAYLDVLRQEFGPSLALVAAGYNAGPGRPRSWIADLGDPRDPAVDVVDWVEAVPFAETRTYIMRVAEALVIYGAREAAAAGAAPAPVRLTDLLRGRAG